MNNKIHVLTFTLMMCLAAKAHSAVSAEEAEKLGDALTPWGAIKAGNEEGTIPAYTGTVQPPASYDPENPGRRPDPFADEKPIYSVSADNLEQHSEHLSPGTKVMLKKYPDYRLDVYPSHRTANYPDWVNENSIKNATECETINGGLGIEGCYAGVPFPIPKDGYQVMWNKMLQFEATGTFGVVSSWLVNSSGGASLQGTNNQWIEIPYYDKDREGPIASDEVYWLYRHETLAPSRKTGEGLLMHESLDMMDTGRRAWQYLPGQRRVKLSPSLAYDTPNPQSGGTANMDDATLFLGAMDRFNFKLIGRQEMLIPYNNFKFKDHEQCSFEVVLTAHFINPDCVRWELHRVWKVEATKREGVRHNYSKRVFYLNEDVFTGLAENYDAAGNLYRFVQTLMVPRYESEGHDTYTTINYDVPSGAYTTFSHHNEAGTYDLESQGSRFWSPQSLSGGGIR